MNNVQKVRDSWVPLELATDLRETGGTGDPGSSTLAPRERRPSRKRRYRRHPKPPYSYLALIAMVILDSPGKRRTLSQILQALSLMSPFCTGDYQGWKDSVRHNLSANDCFVKVLKDPRNPRSKGNAWTVDLSRIPPKALKCQNTPVTRQDKAAFAPDLGLLLPWDESRVQGEGAGEGLSNQAGTPEAQLRCPSDARAGFYPPPSPVPSASSTPVGPVGPQGERGRPRPAWAGHTDTDSSSEAECQPESGRVRVRVQAQPPWELPTSHAQYAPPNALAPPSTRLPPPSNPGLLHFPICSPVPRPSPRANPNPYPRPKPHLDLDAMLRIVPPNKSVFDALIPRQSLTLTDGL